MRLGRLPHMLERLRLDSADALPRHSQLPCRVRQRMLFSRADAVPEAEHDCAGRHRSTARKGAATDRLNVFVRACRSHHRSTHSAKRGGISSQTIIARSTRASRRSSRAPARASSRVAYRADVNDESIVPCRMIACSLYMHTSPATRRHRFVESRGISVRRCTRLPGSPGGTPFPRPDPRSPAAPPPRRSSPRGPQVVA